MQKVDNLRLNTSQEWELEKNKGRIMPKGGKKRNPGLGKKNQGREIHYQSYLIITLGFVFGS